jgi:hypothetical protein
MASPQSIPPGTGHSAFPHRFPPTPSSVAAVRRIVTAQLDHMEPACRDAVVYIGSELASNVVRHAGTPYVVELHTGEMVRIEVTDWALGVPVLRAVTLDAVSGRGLQIVSRLATDWGVDWLDGGKVVWAEVPLKASP